LCESAQTRAICWSTYAFSPYYQGDAVKPYYYQKNSDKAKKLLEQAGYNGCSPSAVSVTVR